MSSTFDDAAVVARRSARLGALLAATDEAPRRVAFPAEQVARAQARGVMVRRLRIAAVAALFLAAVGVPPVRAWIVDSARAFWVALGHPMRTEAVTPSVPSGPPNAAAVGAVSIPVGESFVLRIATRQASGTLTIQVVADSLASATVMGERDAAELVIMPDGLRFVNQPASTAGYVLKVPASVTKLTVQIGREAPRTLRPSADQHWTIDLGARRNAP